ncbi:ABC transporter permease [Lysobacter sp. cf310]|uniref:ABC transporter permease n=1 Tax=Lysobacter sp. cf310 TaxID=1761790 RepID=UPI0008EDBC1B|nr:ABC transporter permease [Lysobacter sp. cf310]SFK94992.1 putative ABC transport system permease protein [Lysobacter sp. cf310]
MSDIHPSTGAARAGAEHAGTISQFITLIPVAIGNAFRARWASATTIACVVLAVAVLSTFLAMARGFYAAGESAGSDRMAVMLGRQAPIEVESDIDPAEAVLLEGAPGLSRLSETSKVSPEVVVSVSRRAKDLTKRINSTLRGMRPEGLRLREHQGFELVEGRPFRSGMYEIIVGRQLAQRVIGLEVGHQIALSGKTWTVVGVFKMSNSLLENEYYADVQSVQAAFDRQNQFQSIYAWLKPGDSVEDLRAFVEADPRFQVDVLTQRDLYRDQVEDTSKIIRYLGWPLAFVLSIGTFAGVLNTMLMVIEGRRRNLSVLLMLGFSPAAIRMTVLLETLLLTMTGALLGTLLMYLFLDGRAASIVGKYYTTIDYTLQVDWTVLLNAMGLAIAVGLVGGALSSLAIPSYRKIKSA